VGNECGAGVKGAADAAVSWPFGTGLDKYAHVSGEGRKARRSQSVAHRLVIGFDLGVDVWVI